MVSNKIVVVCTVAVAAAIVLAAVIANPVLATNISVELNKLKPKPQLPDNCQYTGEYTYRGDPIHKCT